MTRTFALAASVVLGAAIIAAALMAVSGNVRTLSSDLAVLTREVNQIGADVKSLADDLAALTDALTEEDGGAADEPCPSDVEGMLPPGGV